MTQDDIIYNNNQNLFRASESNLIASKEAKALMLDCHWVEPLSDEVGGIVEHWQERRTRFGVRTQDLARQRIYYFDHEGQRPVLEAGAQKEGVKRRFAQWWAHGKFSRRLPYFALWYSPKVPAEKRRQNFSPLFCADVSGEHATPLLRMKSLAP
jgi:hypothetical protein